VRTCTFLLLICSFASAAFAQDWVRTGSGLGVDKVRLAVPDFKPANNDPQNTALLQTFNDTFWNDLDNSGVVELVSKSFFLCKSRAILPKSPLESGTLHRPTRMLAFGNLGVAAGKVVVQAGFTM